MLHDVAESYRRGRFAPAIRHEKRNNFRGIAAAVAECQHFVARRKKVLVQGLLEPGSHPGGQRRRIQVAQIDHRLAAQAELVEDFLPVLR